MAIEAGDPGKATLFSMLMAIVAEDAGKAVLLTIDSLDVVEFGGMSSIVESLPLVSGDWYWIHLDDPDQI